MLHTIMLCKCVGGADSCGFSTIVKHFRMPAAMHLLEKSIKSECDHLRKHVVLLETGMLSNYNTAAHRHSDTMLCEQTLYVAYPRKDTDMHFSGIASLLTRAALQSSRVTALCTIPARTSDAVRTACVVSRCY
jgi:hypothetical protein